MGAESLWHWIIVISVVLLLFGRGKLPQLMGDVANGMKSFKKAMAEEDEQGSPSGTEDESRPPVQQAPPQT
ncbi:sec-independent protein translocase protein TatA [Bradyrhizobium sp. USDA 4011]